MEDLLSLIVIVLYFVISVSASKKKKKEKKEKKAKKRAGREQTVQFEQAFERMTAHLFEEGKQKAETPIQQPKPVMYAKQYGEGEDPCHAQMLGEERASLRMRNAAQSEMAAAAEGEDPCHVGGYADETYMDAQSRIEHSPIFDTEDPDAFARDILRGVIMSEILTRPGKRHCASAMKRGA